MARSVWWLVIAVAAFGLVGTVLELGSYELDPETGTYDSEPTELAYFAWLIASAGAGSAVLVWLSGDRALFEDPPSPLAARMRGSSLILSFAVFLMVFGVGSAMVNDALMRSPFDGAWMPLAAGMAMLVLGMLVPARCLLWSIDEEDAGDTGPGTRRLGALLMILGLVALVISFVAGVGITSRLYGTQEWDDQPYTLYIMAAHLIGLCVVIGGLVVYCGRTPFPHWRVDYRPPGAD
jgi:hypothetical protein